MEKEFYSFASQSKLHAHPWAQSLASASSPPAAAAGCVCVCVWELSLCVCAYESARLLCLCACFPLTLQAHHSGPLSLSIFLSSASYWPAHASWLASVCARGSTKARASKQVATQIDQSNYLVGSGSSGSLSVCHWAMGRLGEASMSIQWRNSDPVGELQPSTTLPIGSELPTRS